jgi:hypothetical protein
VLLCWLALLLIRVIENPHRPDLASGHEDHAAIVGGDSAASPYGLVLQTNRVTSEQKRVLDALPLEAEVLARESVGWLPGLGLAVVPGQVRLSVPVTRSRRHAASMRGVALVTAVDAVEDTWAWEAWGLSGMQRSRVVRWLLEVRRAGGWASLSEVAAWANVTPQGLANRLLPLRQRGVWLPHVGGAEEQAESLGVLPWLLDRFLSVGSVDEDLVEVGVTPSVWAGVLAGVVLVRGAGDVPVEVLAARLGWSAVEVEQVRLVLKRHARAARRLAAPAAFAPTTWSAAP